MRLIMIGLVFLTATGLSVPATAQDTPHVGVVKTTKGRVELRPAGKRSQLVIPGARVHLNDRIRTGNDSQALLQFRDSTVFLLGPNGDLVVDEFVYDPDDNIGAFAASLARGLFRLISGSIPKMRESRMALNTPVAQIGIRGTILLGESAGGETSVVLLDPGGGPPEGAVVVGSPGGQVFLRDRFDGTTVGAAGAPPSTVGTWSQARVRGLLNRLGDPNYILPGREPAPNDRAQAADRAREAAVPGALRISRATCQEIVASARRGNFLRAPRAEGPDGPRSIVMDSLAFGRIGILVTREQIDAAGSAPVSVDGNVVRVVGVQLSRGQHSAFARRCLADFPNL